MEPLVYPLETAIPFASEKVYVSDLMTLMMEDVIIVWPGPAPRNVTPDFDWMALITEVKLYVPGFRYTTCPAGQAAIAALTCVAVTLWT
jgi:hypothetical protein